MLSLLAKIQIKTFLFKVGGTFNHGFAVWYNPLAKFKWVHFKARILTEKTNKKLNARECLVIS